ncbi:MAG: GTP-binding protein, partial [Kordiimonas sp.]
EAAHRHPLWVKELYGFEDHKPETEEYGVSSFVYRATTPFHPQKIHDVLTEDLPGVIRAKGHFWVASRPDWVAEFSLAGAISSIKPLGTWWAAVPHERWPEDPHALAHIKKLWEEPYGDRRQELVFIGADMNKAGIIAALDEALIEPKVEYEPASWEKLADPFPKWRNASEMSQ